MTESKKLFTYEAFVFTDPKPKTEAQTLAWITAFMQMLDRYVAKFEEGQDKQATVLLVGEHDPWLEGIMQDILHVQVVPMPKGQYGVA